MVTDSFRVNVSVSAPCIKEIDELLAKYEMFNGHADFVFTAVRNFFVECTTRFQSYLSQCKEKGQTPLEIVTLFDEATERYGKHLSDSYSNVYPGQNAIQIIIRPKKSFYEKICVLSSYLFRSDDKVSLIKTCRMAVFWYLGKMNASSFEDNSFEEELSGLRALVANSKIDLGVEQYKRQTHIP